METRDIPKIVKILAKYNFNEEETSYSVYLPLLGRDFSKGGSRSMAHTEIRKLMDIRLW
jgi:hypothetical protein